MLRPDRAAILCVSLAIALATCAGCGDPERVLTDEELETSVAFLERPRQLVEVDLGEVFVVMTEPDGKTLFFESKLFGLVDQAYADDFAEALSQRNEALREALRATIQKSDTSEIFDPKLAGLKISLAAVARKTLRYPHLYDILFSDLSIERG